MWRQDARAGGFTNENWTQLNSTLGTLQPYRAVMSGDGTIYFGLQDNGVGKTTGPTTGSAVLGGDGMNVAVHPKNSALAYSEGPDGTLSRTTDGGVTWNDIAPALTQAQFVTPFDMDPTNPNHFVIAAREIEMTTNLETVAGDAWRKVFDLGANADGFSNTATATALHGAASYIGFCGVCDPITEAGTDITKFHNGIATNVSTNCEPTAQGGECWRKAAARGLPNRFINDLAIDPKDHNTVFAVLGGYGRKWYPPPANAPNVGTGHVFVSHDRGQSFTDVSDGVPRHAGHVGDPPRRRSDRRHRRRRVHRATRRRWPRIFHSSRQRPPARRGVGRATRSEQRAPRRRHPWPRDLDLRLRRRPGDDSDGDDPGDRSRAPRRRAAAARAGAGAPALQPRIERVASTSRAICSRSASTESNFSSPRRRATKRTLAGSP